MAERIRTAIVGCGAWGRNLLRVARAHPRLEVTAVADPNPSIATSDVPRFDSLAAVPDPLDAVLIATPGPTHAVVAIDAIDRGAHVFVEKPMATCVVDASRVVAAAARAGRVGMVGHLLRHHPAARAMSAQVASGALGRPLSFHSERCSMPGGRDPDGDVLWSLAPHDVSLLIALDGSDVVAAMCEPIASDACTLGFTMASGLVARMVVSRTSAAKRRRVTITCERGVVVFDDCLPVRKVEVRSGEARSWPEYDASIEPLRAELDAFVRAVDGGERPLTSLQEGLDVVALIERARSVAAQESARSMPPLEARR
ncbi:MAG TPA: Gfo/Idh/MocA family oxidoreductase [Polyangiaceae bacterium]|nr:Gfo/Idh/MocA family oxidoreductase [Polyangiaceae bacterium]